MPRELRRVVRLTSLARKSGHDRRCGTGSRGRRLSASRPSNTCGGRSMEFAPDFDEFIGSLTAHGVEFVVFGDLRRDRRARARSRSVGLAVKLRLKPTSSRSEYVMPSGLRRRIPPLRSAGADTPEGSDDKDYERPFAMMGSQQIPRHATSSLRRHGGRATAAQPLRNRAEFSGSYLAPVPASTRGVYVTVVD